MSSKVISAVLGKFDSESSQGKVNAVLGTALALFPLMIDIIYSDSLYICPVKNRKFYSLFLMMAPTICALILGLILLVQFLKDKNQIGKSQNILKVFPKVFLSLIVVIVTFGCSFIFSKYYVCFRMDPTFKDETTKMLLINESRLIGWTIILTGLILLFVLTFLQFTILYPSRVEQCWNAYKTMQYNQTNELLKTKINDLSKTVIEAHLGSTLREIEELDEGREDKLIELMKVYHKLAKELLINVEITGKSMKRYYKINKRALEEKRKYSKDGPDEKYSLLAADYAIKF